jgi:hypothetical protein
MPKFGSFLKTQKLWLAGMQSKLEMPASVLIQRANSHSEGQLKSSPHRKRQRRAVKIALLLMAPVLLLASDSTRCIPAARIKVSSSCLI